MLVTINDTKIINCDYLCFCKVIVFDFLLFASPKDILFKNSNNIEQYKLT